MVPAGLVVQHADRAAELRENDYDRLIEQRFAGHGPRHSLKIRHQRTERGIEHRALRIERVHIVSGLVVDAAVMIPTVECGLDESCSLARGDKIAGDHQRVAESGAAVLRMLIGAEAEQAIDSRCVHERLRLIVEIVHVQRLLAEGAGGAIGIELVEEVPSIGKARRAVRMSDCR